MRMVLVDKARVQTGEVATPSAAPARIDRFTELALAATDRFSSRLEAVESERVGIYVGNVFAGWGYGEPQLANLVAAGPGAVHAFQATAWFPAAAQGEISIRRGWTGVAKTFSGSQCAFGEALLGAAMSVMFDRIDVACVGMAEATSSVFLSQGAALAPEGVGEESFFILLAREWGAQGFPIEIELMEVGKARPCSEIGWAALLDRGFAAMIEGRADCLELAFSPNRMLKIRPAP